MLSHTPNRPYRKLDILPQTHRGAELEQALNASWRKRPHLTSLLAEFGPDIDEHAIFMAGHGVSHRKDFPIQVGAVTIGLVEPPKAARRGTPSRVIVNEGYNLSPYKGAPKDCAEIRSLRMGDERSPGGWLAALVEVAGPAVPGLNKQINNFDAPTLQPCISTCQPIIYEHSAVTPRLLIRTLGIDVNSTVRVEAMEEFTVGAMQATYNQVEAPLTSLQLAQMGRTA